MCSVKLVLFPVILYVVFAKDLPTITTSETNASVVVGRDVYLTCHVENLQNYVVAWLRVDTQTILTVGPLVVTKNTRVGVLSGPHSWTLALRDARLTDAGQYMCQLNTDPMVVRIYQLQVLVPPNIVDANSTGEVIVEEGGSIALYCTASGIPQPNITWRREDSKPLIIAGKNVSKREGAWLNITSAHRDMNCILLCIASNRVPPSVSKRIVLHVLSRPTVEVIQGLVSAHINSVATLRCHIAAYPPPAVYWSDMNKNRLTNGMKYETMTMSRAHEHASSLTINNVSRGDAGAYQCLAVNSMGTESATVTLHTLPAPTSFSSTVSIVTSPGPVTTAANNFATSEFTSTEIDEENPNSNLPVIISQHQMQYADNCCRYHDIVTRNGTRQRSGKVFNGQACCGDTAAIDNLFKYGLGQRREVCYADGT